MSRTKAALEHCCYTAMDGLGGFERMFSVILNISMLYRDMYNGFNETRKQLNVRHKVRWLH